MTPQPVVTTTQPDVPRSRGPRHLIASALLAVSRGAGVLAQVLVQIAVGHLGGAAALGLLQVFVAWTNVLGEVVGGGYPTRVLRDSAVQSAAGDFPAIRRGIRRSSLRVLALAALAALVSALAVPLLPLARDARILLLTIALSAPLYALARVAAEALKGTDRPLAAVTLENLTLPVTVLLACALMVAMDLELTGSRLLLAAMTGTGLTLVLLAFSLRRGIAGRGATGQSPTIASPPGEQVHLWANALLGIGFLQLPFLLLPLFAGNADIGRFAVAFKLVNVITTLLILLGAVFGPRFARAGAAGDSASLRALLLRTQLISGLIFVPGAALLLLFHDPLARLFGLAPGSLQPLLSVLCAGQLVNAITGLPGVLLTLTGGARQEMVLQGVSTVATAAALLILAGPYGVVGAAVAVSGGFALKNLASYLAALRHLRHL